MLAKWNQKAWLEPEDETSFPITYLSWMSLARSPTRGDVNYVREHLETF